MIELLYRTGAGMLKSRCAATSLKLAAIIAEFGTPDSGQPGKASARSAAARFNRGFKGLSMTAKESSAHPWPDVKIAF